MKKIYLFLIICCIWGLSFPVSGLEVTDNITISKEEHLQTHLSNETRKMLNDVELYRETMGSIKIADNPIVIVYNQVYWKYADQPLNVVLEYAEREELVDYIILDTTVSRIRTRRKDDAIISIGVNQYQSDTSFQFIVDLNNGNASSYKILGKDRTVTNVYCFDGSASHQGTILYYLTTDGTFVRYYPHEYSDYQDFTLTDFQKYGVEYYEYRTSYENNYREDGAPSYGSAQSFLDFVASGGEYTPNDNADVNPSSASDGVSTWIPVSIGTAIVVAIAGAVGIAIFRNRKKKSAV